VPRVRACRIPLSQSEVRGSSEGVSALYPSLMLARVLRGRDYQRNSEIIACWFLFFTALVGTLNPVSYCLARLSPACDCVVAVCCLTRENRLYLW